MKETIDQFLKRGGTIQKVLYKDIDQVPVTPIINLKALINGSYKKKKFTALNKHKDRLFA